MSDGAAAAPEKKPLLARVGNDNAAGEYYLPDLVMLAAADGRGSAVIETEDCDRPATMLSAPAGSGSRARARARARIMATAPQG